MYFNSFLYPFFLALAVAIFWLIPVRFRTYVIIFFSLFFYAFTSFAHLFLIIGLSILVYFVGKKIRSEAEPRRKKNLFIGAIILIILTLIWFKYSNLFLGSVLQIFGRSNNSLLSLALPLGISFFTFEFVHYLIDLYHGRIPDHSAGEFFSFAFFFPSLTSGPIKRFQTFLATMREHKLFSRDYFFSGLLLILLGYSQKYFVADNLVSRTAFLSAPAVAPTGFALLSGLFLYSFRLYFDFAGLSNIAIGSALLFGVKVPINFSHPFFKSDLAAFWRSWHMSLTNWIRDYVYMPLVFKFRNSRFMIVFGLVVTMAMVGLWHGSSWNFLFFGIYHGTGLALLQVYRGFKIKRRLPQRLGYVFGVAATFIFVSLGWGFFVTHSLSDSILLYQRIFAKLV